MIKLLKIEWRKLRAYRMFWGLTILYFIFLVLMELVLNKFEVHKNGLSIKLSNFPIYRFPDVWHMIAYAATYLKFIPAVLMIVLITNEFEFKTVRQNLIDGISRNEFLLSKLMIVVITAIVSTLLVILAGLYLGYSYTEEVTLAILLKKTSYIWGYFLELLTFLLFASMLAFIVKRAGFAMGILILYYWIAENIIVALITSQLEKKKYGWLENVLPLNASRNLVREPVSQYLSLGEETIVSANLVYISLAFCLLFCIIVWRVFKRDL